MKRTAKALLIALMAIVLVASFSACSQIRDAKAIADALKSAAADSAAAGTDATPDAEETAAPDETAAEESATPAKGGKPGYWPEDITGDAPAFKYGAYDEENQSKLEADGTVTWALNFNEVKKENVDEYLQTLKDKGYETFNAETNGEMTFGGTLKKDGKDYITMIGGWNEDTGVCTLAVSYPSK